jgi:hypothetical protein
VKETFYGSLPEEFKENRQTQEEMDLEKVGYKYN